MDYPKSVPSVGLVNGKFVDENPVNGSPGSLIPAVWGNAVTEELLNVVQAGGLQPSETARDQLLTAIRTIIQSSLPVEQVRTTLAAYGITDAYTKAEIEEKLKNTSALPVGVMVPFPKGTVPPGYLEVDGSVQSAATYPDLYAYLGTTFNTGSEPAGFFRLPESRGEFLRGWDHGRGVDVGRVIGSYQADDFKSHNHKLTFGANVGGGGNISGGTGFGSFSTAAIEASGGSETRPRNWSVMWCIKAWNAPTNQGNIDVAALAAQVQSVQKVAVVGSHRGLTVSASGLNSLVTVTADQLVVGNEVSFKNLSGLSLSINSSTVGANGLDSGVLGASTWYSVWVIWNGVTPSGLLSLSSVTPTLPAGYTHKALVGWIFTDATANKYPLGFIQKGRKAKWVITAGSNLSTLRIPVSGVAGTWNATAPTWAAVSLANHVPPTAVSVSLSAIASYNGGAQSNVYVAPSSSYLGSRTNSVPPLSTTLAGGTGSALDVVSGDFILESMSIYVVSQTAAGAVAVLGWENNL
ncbi:phage tail protein [Pseudomonas gingeri]|uniref:phage tail protein n=1 Tax=Pseudomonas TaxID=286 RepID=UPI0015BCC1AF|nr:phage tail protein [Pseudomonas sp. Ost2]NWE69945.1 tail fiber protein [Pseudomonas gingeri]BBP75248.1 hypothetical protein PHLH7_13520 [Pseudomonas sp. Ost2]